LLLKREFVSPKASSTIQVSEQGFQIDHARLVSATLNMTERGARGNPAGDAALTDPGDFDLRLKRTDENRWIASRYARQADRERLMAIYCLNHELQRALSLSDPMLGRIRVQWWRDTLESLAAGQPARRHDLSIELARVLALRRDLFPAFGDLLDRFDDALDDHLHGVKHAHGGVHEARHLAAEASLTRLAGRALAPDASPTQLDALSRCGEAYVAVGASLPDAASRLATAREASRNLSAAYWPAIVHLAIASRELSPLKRRWRVFWAIATRRL